MFFFRVDVAAVSILLLLRINLSVPYCLTVIDQYYHTTCCTPIPAAAFGGNLPPKTCLGRLATAHTSFLSFAFGKNKAKMQLSLPALYPHAKRCT
jgi:hypothetical protein